MLKMNLTGREEVVNQGILHAAPAILVSSIYLYFEFFNRQNHKINNFNFSFSEPNIVSSKGDKKSSKTSKAGCGSKRISPA